VYLKLNINEIIVGDALRYELDGCLPSIYRWKGGQGVKDLLLFNLSLLAKWHWHLLVEDGSLWKKVEGCG
jgi:hypothetical protein